MIKVIRIFCIVVKDLNFVVKDNDFFNEQTISSLDFFC